MRTPSDEASSRPRRPGLTVAIPTYNGERYLAETLASIQAQTGASFDLIVCDDQSTDATHQIVALFPSARLFVNPERLGLAGNWNACVERSDTEWVAIVHQDDLLLPGHLAAHLHATSLDPTLAMIASAADPIDAQGQPITDGSIEPGRVDSQDRLFPTGTFVEHLSISNPLRCSAVTLRASAHEQLGGFDPSYRYVVDWDLWLRLARAYPVAWLAHPTVAFRWHPASETHTFKTGLADLEETERLLSVFPPTRATNDRLSRAYLNRAYEAAHVSDRWLILRALTKAVRRSPQALRLLLGDPRLLGRITVGLLGRGDATRPKSITPLKKTPD